jgi:hypothetical protein
LTPVGRVQVADEVNVSVTRNDELAPTFVDSNADLIVTLVALVTVSVAVNVKAMSTYRAEALIAVPLVVVKPLSEVQVALSSAVPMTAV